jgi:hypothetical protein
MNATNTRANHSTTNAQQKCPEPSQHGTLPIENTGVVYTASLPSRRCGEKVAPLAL